MARAATRNDALGAGVLLAPAYLWLTVAVFLPLSAMLFFSFLSAAPFTTDDWHVTGANYAEFLSRTIYPDLLGRSLLLAAIVTLCCVLIGYPCAYVLARHVKGRSREALFLLVLALLYLVLVGIAVLEGGISSLGEGVQESLFSSVSNPVAGLCVGILATVGRHVRIPKAGQIRQQQLAFSLKSWRRKVTLLK